MIEISLNNVIKSFGFKNILNGLNIEIKTGDRVSIIGENGCGKTTILNIINSIENVDSGTIAIRKGAKIGYLNQQPENIYNDKLVKDILYDSFEEILNCKRQLEKYEIKMVNEPENISIINKYLDIQEKYMKLGGYEINSLIDKVAYGLNIDKLLNSTFKDLSGGEQKRVVLASIIVKKPDILLLDEPTNHLDINTIEWLENFLNKYNGTIVIVSHDRYFLDNVTNKTVLIENGKAIVFHCNYTKFLKENDDRIELEFKEYKDQQKLIVALKRKIKQLEEFGRLAYPGGESFYKRAENIRKRLERLEKVEKPNTKKELPLNFGIEKRTGNNVLTINKYDLYIDSKELIRNINFKINYKDRVCILGNNGSGKSTLLKRIIDNSCENIKLGSNVKIGYIPQQINYNDDLTILDFSRKYFEGDESHLRSALSKYQFYGENVFKKITKLSGGEKVRLKLFALIQDNCNFIILDEPTNHIDISTKETLEEALKNYEGTVLFVSHDRYFINKIATKVLYISDKKITEYCGNYDYFIEHKK